MDTEIRVKTHGGRLLARGVTHDPEDSRMTHRLHPALRILSVAGADSTRSHSTRTVVEYGRERHECDHNCAAAWPAWVAG